MHELMTRFFGAMAQSNLVENRSVARDNVVDASHKESVNRIEDIQNQIRNHQRHIDQLAGELEEKSTRQSRGGRVKEECEDIPMRDFHHKGNLPTEDQERSYSSGLRRDIGSTYMEWTIDNLVVKGLLVGSQQITLIERIGKRM